VTKSIDWKPLLQRNPIFSTVDEKRIDALLADGISKERVYAKDKDIVRQGEEGDSLFVIGSGSAEALLAVAKEETIRLSTMREGAVFGEMAFFGRRERAATVRAKEDCTVLEIGGPEFQNLVDEYPDIRSRLLLLMGERLRDTNEQILALHLKTVDEKLKLFNNRLDNEQRSVEAFLTAAKTVFDQTKIRTDEVISSAERSRDRLTKSATLVGTFVTALIGLAGLFGWSKVNDATKSVSEAKKSLEQQVNDSAKWVELAKTEAAKSVEEAKKSEVEAKKSAQDLEEIKKIAVESIRNLKADLTQSQIDIYHSRFFDTLEKRDGDGARRAYTQIKNAGGLIGDELHSLLWGLEYLVVAKAEPPKSDQEKSVKNFVLLFQWAVLDAKRARDKLDAYYLLLVYAYLADQTAFEQKEGDFKNLATPRDARYALEEYVNSTPEEQWPTATKELADRIKGEPGEREKYLRNLSELARVRIPKA